MVAVVELAVRERTMEMTFRNVDSLIRELESFLRKTEPKIYREDSNGKRVLTVENPLQTVLSIVDAELTGTKARVFKNLINLLAEGGHMSSLLSIITGSAGIRDYPKVASAARAEQNKLEAKATASRGPTA